MGIIPYIYEREDFETKVAPILSYGCTNEVWKKASVDYYLCMKKFDELRSIYSSARYLLWLAVMPDQEYKSMGIASPDTILWLRVTYWHSSIMWFNYVEDYIIKALCLMLHLHNMPNTNDPDYKDEMKKTFSFTTVRQKLKQKGSVTLIKLMDCYKVETESVHHLADRLMHGKMIAIQELNQILNSTSMLELYVMKYNLQNPFDGIDDKNIVYSNKELKENAYCFADVVDKTIRATHILYNYVDQVRNNILSKDKFFAYNENGAIVGVNRNFTY
jgi:hypothetical protein